MTAELIGGPFDGETVEFLGSCHQRDTRRHLLEPIRDTRTVTYTWERRGEKVVGVFAGFTLTYPDPPADE